MKKIKYISFTLLTASFFLLSGCDSFLDVNDNPTKVKQVTLDVLLPTAIEATAYSHYSAGQTIGRVTHQIDHVGGYYSEFRMEGVWSKIYLKALNNLDMMVTQANAQNSPHYAGIGRVLQAVNIGLLADFWEDAPYSDGLNGSLNITPAYDNQEKLYGQIQTYLDEAIVLLAAGNSDYQPGRDDMIYGGNTGKWIRLAHSLKARYLLHLSNKTSVNKTEILSEAAQGMTGNDDDFQLFYNSVNKNPYHTGVALANLTGNLTITHGKFLVDLMNGTAYPVFDPRLPLIADNSGAATYIGLESFNDAEDAHNCEISVNTFYAKESAPVVMMSFSELKLIEAEAALGTNASAAHAAYLAGISANMDKLGTDEAAKTAYLNDPAVQLNGTTDLAHIMKEKMVTLFLNPEAWNDMRRHKFAPAVFKGFFEPTFNERSEPAQRALHPTTELNRNAQNQAAFGKEFTASMWRDQN